jgi:GTP cyclohydrolase I
MKKEERFMVDVGMKGLPFPIKALSREDAGGQQTVANISVSARIMHDFEAGWIDRFIQLIHKHRDRIGTSFLKENIKDYISALKASSVRIDFNYPFFIQKITPASREKCLVKYQCTYSAHMTVNAKITFKMKIPCITTYPDSDKDKVGGLMGQLSFVLLEVESSRDVYPEELVDLVDSCVLSPVYSYLTDEDQHAVIQKIHSERKTSVVTVDEIKKRLATDRSLDYYSVNSLNFGLLHSYNTVVGTEKSIWVPFSGYDEEEY